jgi:hypothetical protein
MWLIIVGSSTQGLHCVPVCTTVDGRDAERAQEGRCIAGSGVHSVPTVLVHYHWQ